MKIPKVLFIHKCVEAIQEIPKLVERKGLDFILSNKVVIVIDYIKKKTLIEAKPTPCFEVN